MSRPQTRYRKKKYKRTRRKRHGGSAGAIVFNLTNDAGFGSVVNFLCHAYIHAKETGKEFFVNNVNWHYSYKNGWHDYFKSLNNLPVNRDTNITIFKHGKINNIPQYSFDKYTDCIKNIFILNDDLVKKGDDFIHKMGTSYKSVYVRMGDKVTGNHKEADAFPLVELVNIMQLSNDTTLFLMTDDYNVKGNLEKLLPSVKIFTLTPPENNGSSTLELMRISKDNMRKHCEELLISMYIVMKSEKGWVWNESNIGRFMKMGSPDNLVLYPINNKLRGDSIIDPAKYPL